MRNADKKIVSKSRTGVLYGIGLGPGDPQLLTLKSKQILDSVSVIFAPKAGAEASSLAADIIKSHVRNKNKISKLVFPMTRDKKLLQKFWEQAAEKVYKTLAEGKDAAFVTLGDPFIYSTYGYLLKAVKKLDENLTTVTLPGISSVNAAASLMNIPLVEGDEKYTVMPLPENLNDISRALSFSETVVLLKIGKNLPALLNYLKRKKLDKTSYFAQRIGLKGQIVTENISSLPKNTAGYLSMMIIKKYNGSRRL